jgi:hypothetical protein
MKLSKQIATMALVTLFSFQAYSQLSVGGQLSYLKLLGGVSISNIGIGVKGNYGISEKNVTTFGFNYYLADKNSYTTVGDAYESSTTPQYVDVNAEDKVSFIQLYGGAKRYFVGEYEEDLISMEQLK